MKSYMEIDLISAAPTHAHAQDAERPAQHLNLAAAGKSRPSLPCPTQAQDAERPRRGIRLRPWHPSTSHDIGALWATQLRPHSGLVHTEEKGPPSNPSTPVPITQIAFPHSLSPLPNFSKLPVQPAQYEGHEDAIGVPRIQKLSF